MSTVYEIPVSPRDAVLTRRMLRSIPDAAPRDARPSRARRERLPLSLRTWGPKHARPVATPAD